MLFIDNVLTNSGDGQKDLRIYEYITGSAIAEAFSVALRPACGSTLRLLEEANLVADADGYFLLPEHSPGGQFQFDIDLLRQADRVTPFSRESLSFDAVKMIADDPGGNCICTVPSYTTCAPGADIDAVEALMNRDVSDVCSAESYYVPQSLGSAGLIEGPDAAKSFVMCPNNDVMIEGAPNSARIKVICSARDGRGIPGIRPEDIYIALNGGTTPQGYMGNGADSVISNGQYNPGCPDLFRIEADAPTNDDGVTYITFAGSTPGSPGMAIRDPSRKWGHYDSDLPVVVWNGKQPVQLLGRLRTNANGADENKYALTIKNFDLFGGLGPAQGVGERVGTEDFNAVVSDLDCADNCSVFKYWKDFDGNGEVEMPDLNLLLSHWHHDCSTPTP